MAYELTQSLDFERGSSQRASITNSYGLTRWGAFTLEAWIMLESQPPTDQQFGIATIGWNTIGAHLWYEDRAGVLNLRAYRHAWGTNTTEMFYNIALNLEQWYHVAFTKDASNNGKLYLDGVEVASLAMGSATGSTRAVQSNVGAAWNNGSNTHFFDGKISLHRVWSVARTQSEIAANMCNVFGGPTANLRAEHSLDGILSDASGNGYDLSVFNGPVFSMDVPAICVPSPGNLGSGFFALMQ